MAQQEITSEEMYGIAKRVNRELEVFPMHTHSAICEMIRVGMQHRNLAMQDAVRREQADKQERALKMQETQMKMAQDAANRTSAAQMGLGPVPVPN